MMSHKPEGIQFLEERLGQEVFVSKWLVISQEETDQGLPSIEHIKNK